MEMAKDAEKNEGKKNEIYFVNLHIFHGVNAAKEGPTFRAGSSAIDFTQLGHRKYFLVPIADDPALNGKLYMY